MGAVQFEGAKFARNPLSDTILAPKSPLEAQMEENKENPAPNFAAEMHRLQKFGGVLFLVLWGLAPCLHVHHAITHHLFAHHDGQGCSHHAHPTPSDDDHEENVAFAASDACELCDWQWAPVEESRVSGALPLLTLYCVQSTLGRTSPAFNAGVVSSDHPRRGPPSSGMIV